MNPLSKSDVRRLKAQAQSLKATLKLGRSGLSAPFLQALNEALTHHPLLKVKFDEFKEQRKELAQQMAERTGSHLITVVGHVAVLHRPQPPSAEGGMRSP
jgi:RNA-binding protein